MNGTLEARRHMQTRRHMPITLMQDDDYKTVHGSSSHCGPELPSEAAVAVVEWRGTAVSLTTDRNGVAQPQSSVFTKSLWWKLCKRIFARTAALPIPLPIDIYTLISGLSLKNLGDLETGERSGSFSLASEATPALYQSSLGRHAHKCSIDARRHSKRISAG